MREPPFDILSCSWPRPVVQENGRWTAEPEWDAPTMPTHPVPHWKSLGSEVCWTINWREHFKRGLKVWEHHLCGEMRGFHIVFRLRMRASGTLVFWDDDGREETLRFEASKRRYQKKFRGARLRGEKTDYRTHCRGDACANFAPPELIAVRHPLPIIDADPGNAEFQTEARTRDATVPDLPQVESGISAQESARVEVAEPPSPLVSYIMPTYNRRQFVPLVLRHFLAQDYPNKELVIVDDGSDPISDLEEGVSGVRYIRLSSRSSIGAKRNLACQQAHGEVIAHWDDDDWYAPDRLRYQAAPLLLAKADITGLENAFVLELATGVFWRT